MTPRTRKRLFTAVRIVVCLAALAIVLRGVTIRDRIVLKDGTQLTGLVLSDGDPVEMRLSTDGQRVVEVPHTNIALDERGELRIAYGLRTAWRFCNKLLLLLALALHAPVGILQGVRLRWLLRAQDISIRYWHCVKLSFAGNFLNFATPLGSHAGDVFKAYFVTTHTSRKTEAVTTIALDRAIGLGTLILCVAGIVALSPGSSRLAEFRPYVLTILAVGAAGLVAYFSPPLRRFVLPKRWLSRLPMFEHLRRIDQAAWSLASRWRIVLLSVLITVALQVLAIGAYFTVAVAMGLDAHAGNVIEYYAYFYTGAVIQALPGPPQGLGTVELAYRYFLAPFGSPSQILCTAFLIRVVVLTCALPGLLVTLTGSYRPKAARVVPSLSEQPPRSSLDSSLSRRPSSG